MEDAIQHTKMTVAQNTKYTKKSPGWFNLGAFISRALPYVNTNAAAFPISQSSMSQSIFIQCTTRIGPSKTHRNTDQEGCRTSVR